MGARTLTAEASGKYYYDYFVCFLLPTFFTIKTIVENPENRRLSED